MLILTNFRRFPENWKSSSGISGRAVMLNESSPWDFLKHSKDADLVIINCHPDLTLQLAALYLLFPWRRRPILTNDIVLRAPRNWKQSLILPLKRFLLSRVEHFTLHFKNIEGYSKYYGIDSARVSYLPFKANIRYRYQYKVGSDGEYVLCFGRSERDYDTFFAAMEKLPDLPAVIPPPDWPAFHAHHCRFSRSLDELPKNVRVIEDDGSAESLIRIIEGAKLVVLPIVAASIAPSAIGTYLNAMVMGKCVIVSHGIATTNILVNGEALLVPNEDPDALAATIRRAWDDPELRERTAEIGRQYAEACGGEPELRQRVLDRALERLPLKRQRS